MSCSSGTYIRVLCEDIGRKLGVPATMSYLRRTRLGNFEISKTYGFDDLNRLKEEGKLETTLIPIDEAFSYEKVTLSEIFDIPLKNGAKIEKSFLKENEITLDETDRYLFYSSDGAFVGIYHFDEEYCRPLKMFYIEE